MNDEARKAIVGHYKKRNISATDQISHDKLKYLHSQCKSPQLSWLQFELILRALINGKIYAPKTMANELMALLKIELDPELAGRFANVVESLVKHCREISKSDDEELQEKWCEIIEWTSWCLRLPADEDYD